MKRDLVLSRIATLGKIGSLPAPGTFGSLVACIFGLVITLHGNIFVLIVAISMITIIAFPAINAHERLTHIKDDKAVIIDEVIGQWLVFLVIPTPPAIEIEYLTYVAVSFILFRFFDITKLPPCRQAEALPGAAGVIADDVIAGIMAGGVIIIYGWAV